MINNYESLEVQDAKSTSRNTDEEAALIDNFTQERNSRKKAAALGFTITALFSGGLALLGVLLNSRNKSKHPSKPIASPTPSVTPSVTAKPSAMASVTPSVTSSASASVTPSVSFSKTPSSSPTVLGKSTYTFQVLDNYEHQVCIKNNDQQSALTVNQMSFTINEPIVWVSGNLAFPHSTLNYTQNSDQNYTSNIYPQPPLIISVMQMQCVQYQVRNYEPDYGNSTYFASNTVPMNPTNVAVNDQSISLDGIVPFNPQTVSRIKPAVRYDNFDVYYTGNMATNIPYSQTRMIVYDGGITYDPQTLKFYLFGFPALDFQLPEIAVNKIQYSNSFQSFLTIEALDDMSEDPCVFNNFDLPLLNQTSQTLLINNALTMTQVWQADGVNIDFNEPCTDGSQYIAQFIQQLGTTFAAAGKKVMVHLPGDLTRAQQLPANVTCAIARSSNYISIIGVYVAQPWQGTQIVTADQAPLNQLEETINYYQSLNCINFPEQFGLLQLAEANSWYVSSVSANNNYGKNQPIQAIPRGQYDLSPEEAALYNLTEENTGLVKWNCVDDASQCGDYNPVPSDIVFIQGQNQSGLWGYSPTLQNTTNGTYYYVMSGPNSIAAIRDANLAIQKEMSFVIVAPSGADVSNGTQSLFWNIYQTLNNGSAEKQYIQNNEAAMPYQIPAEIAASIEQTLSQLPQEALSTLGRGIVGYVTHKITSYELNSLLQSYGFSEQHIYWLNYSFSRAITFGLTAYFSGDALSAFRTTLNLTSADLYLKYVVGCSQQTTSLVTGGLSLGAQAINSLPKAVNAMLGIGSNVLIEKAAPMIEDAAIEVFNKCKSTFSYASSKVSTMFKAATHVLANPAEADVAPQTILTV